MAISVLLVDDDPDFTIMLRTLLQGQDFQILSVNSGEEAVSLSETTPLDVIVLDLLMPGMDGWEVCRKIRAFSDIPILILSALGAPANVARALDAGADGINLPAARTRAPGGTAGSHSRSIIFNQEMAALL